ncbi:MAG: DUF2226 domain-containing protein [Theionarchaea archaeon]|nr:DUF2226 domain-containing protein [Theionarchaea archaeon]
MRFPAGKSTIHKAVHPKEVLDTVETGYIRLTVEDDDLTDHYIFYRDNEIVGAFSEYPPSGSNPSTLQGAQALDTILSLNNHVLAETVIYSKETLKTIEKNHPEIFFKTETQEKFRIGKTVFTGTLATVKSGDFLTVTKQLQAHNLIGCLRVTRETQDAIQEGVVVFLENPVAALFESQSSILLGDDALHEIALTFSMGRVYTLDRKFIEDFLFLQNASRIKSPVADIISSEKARDDFKRFMTLQRLGLERGNLILNAPCNGTFSFDALLKSAASRKFDGYLWVKAEETRGLMILGNGKIQAAFFMDTSDNLTGTQALENIYESMEHHGIVDFYQLPSPPSILQTFDTGEDTDTFLVKRLMGEMGEDLIKDLTVAKEFKKRWKDKRKHVGE